MRSKLIAAIAVGLLASCGGGNDEGSDASTPAAKRDRAVAEFCAAQTRVQQDVTDAASAGDEAGARDELKRFLDRWSNDTNRNIAAAAAAIGVVEENQIVGDLWKYDDEQGDAAEYPLDANEVLSASERASAALTAAGCVD